MTCGVPDRLDLRGIFVCLYTNCVDRFWESPFVVYVGNPVVVLAAPARQGRGPRRRQAGEPALRERRGIFQTKTRRLRTEQGSLLVLRPAR